MRAVSVAIATVLVGLASAQTGNLGIPSCANSCIGSFGKCGGFDAQCICTDKSLIANLACCVSVSCDKADQDSERNNAILCATSLVALTLSTRYFDLRPGHLRQLQR